MPRSTKPIEMYAHYLNDPANEPIWRNNISISRDDLEQLVKMAGLFIHPPDKGTGVIRINQSKTRKSSEVL